MPETSTEPEFKLHRLVRQVADEFPETADPGVLADKVFDRIPEDQYLAAMRAMLRSYVRTVVGQTRTTHAVHTAGKADAGDTDLPRTQSQYVRDMVAGIWRAQLLERTHGAHGWVLLRDCTHEDLAAAARERRELSAANAAAAARYEALDKLLAEHGATRVGELPDGVLEAALSA